VRHYFFVLWILSFSLLFAVDSEGDSSEQILNQIDIKALRDWIDTKRKVTVKERGGGLSLSGEVRVELQSVSEKKNGLQQRGRGGQVPDTARHAWDVEMNLMLDYRTERTWLATKMKFDNNMGIEKGSSDHISLDRAVFGVHLVNAETYTINLEVGRSALIYTFDSKVQFGAIMDGLLFKYDQALENIGDLFFHGGPFLVNRNIDHYAYVGEFGLLNIGRTGFYSKLSAINWNTKRTHNKLRNDAFRFFNIQWMWGYTTLLPKMWEKNLTLYAGGLVNAAARGTDTTRGAKERFAWYMGCSMGKLRKKWDWSLNVNYQWVQAQAVPDFDFKGIGRGNAAKEGLYSSKNMGEGSPNPYGEGVGRSNYRGWAMEFLYLLTDNITIYQEWRQSINQTSRIKPLMSYKQYEIELIYGF